MPPTALMPSDNYFYYIIMPMNRVNLIKARETLSTLFVLNKFVRLDDVDTLYTRFYNVLEENPELQEHVTNKLLEYKQFVKENSILYRTLKNYLKTVSEIYNYTFDSLYEIDFLKYIIVNFSMKQGSDYNYINQDSLYAYIFNLLTDITDSYTAESDWSLLNKQLKHKINIKYEDFIKINLNFESYKNRISEKFSNLYDYYAYSINRNYLNKVSGATLSLFILPIKAISTDLIKVIDEAITIHYSADDKIQMFINKYDIKGTNKDVFICRYQNPNFTNKDIANKLGVSVDTIEKSTNSIMLYLKAELATPDGDKRKFKKLLNDYLG